MSELEAFRRRTVPRLLLLKSTMHEGGVKWAESLQIEVVGMLASKLARCLRAKQCTKIDGENLSISVLKALLSMSRHDLFGRRLRRGTGLWKCRMGCREVDVD